MAKYVSAVNQPSRIFLNSSSDQTNDPASNETYDAFRILFPTGILEPKSCQLTRATIPNAQLSIPDYMLVFWYIRIDNTGGLEYKYVRFLPSTFDLHDPDQDLFGLPVNRLIANYQDFVNLLNEAAAAADDPLNVDPDTSDPLHIANDVEFAYDPYTRKITMTGLDTNYKYLIPGYDDDEVMRLIPYVKLRTILSGVTLKTVVQPELNKRYLNLRVGFCSQNTLIDNQRDANVAIFPSSWGDLVYSQNIYVYSNLVQGSSYGSEGQRNLLSVVPCNAQPLGVIQYTAPMSAPLTRIVKEIYEIEIIMKDDNNLKYNVENNALVAIEIALAYD
jgi:hypothetical protein